MMDVFPLSNYEDDLNELWNSLNIEAKTSLYERSIGFWRTFCGNIDDGFYRIVENRNIEWKDINDRCKRMIIADCQRISELGGQYSLVGDFKLGHPYIKEAQNNRYSLEDDRIISEIGKIPMDVNDMIRSHWDILDIGVKISIMTKIFGSHKNYRASLDWDHYEPVDHFWIIEECEDIRMIGPITKYEPLLSSKFRHFSHDYRSACIIADLKDEWTKTYKKNYPDLAKADKIGMARLIDTPSLGPNIILVQWKIGGDCRFINDKRRIKELKDTISQIAHGVGMKNMGISWLPWIYMRFYRKEIKKMIDVYRCECILENAKNGIEIEISDIELIPSKFSKKKIKERYKLYESAVSSPRHVDLLVSYMNLLTSRQNVYLVIGAIVVSIISVFTQCEGGMPMNKQMEDSINNVGIKVENCASF